MFWSNWAVCSRATCAGLTGPLLNCRIERGLGLPSMLFWPAVLYSMPFFPQFLHFVGLALPSEWLCSRGSFFATRISVASPILSLPLLIYDCFGVWRLQLHSLSLSWIFSPFPFYWQLSPVGASRYARDVKPSPLSARTRRIPRLPIFRSTNMSRASPVIVCATLLQESTRVRPLRRWDMIALIGLPIQGKIAKLTGCPFSLAIAFL